MNLCILYILNAAEGGAIISLLGAMNKPLPTLITMAIGSIVPCVVARSIKKMRLVQAISIN